MAGYQTKLKGYRLKNGKLVKVEGYGLDSSARIRQKKSKRIRVKRKTV